VGKKKVARPHKFRRLNAAGAWEAVDQATFNRELGAVHGLVGEQQLGFYLNEAGYWILEGPSGEGGHGLNAHGFDGVAFNPDTKELIIYDNKAHAAATVKDSTALENNLKKNLEELVEKIEARKATGDAIPHSDHILKNLKQALEAIGKRGKGWPPSVKLYVFGISGRVSDLRRAFKARLKTSGLPIEFISWDKMKKARTPGIRTAEAKKEVERLTEFVIKEEPKAAQAIIQRVEKARVFKGGKKRVVGFIEKRLPKLVAESVLKGSAKAAAHRAASLVPVVGWAFDAQDAYKGAEDIFRGHVARGLAGIGLSIADVGSDFLHLGDAVSGVGGTALSVGAQVGIMAGQIKIEVDRKEEKLKELAQEVEQLGELPSDDRLRSEYDLDNDEIADYRREFAMQESEPEPAPEMPELPPDIPLPDPELPELDEPPPDELEPPPASRNRTGDAPPPPKPRNQVDEAPKGGEQLRQQNDRVPRWSDQPIA
jgi:hypothetical protein